ncbi:MAG TPA: hypothetical protein PKX91_06635 [Clostridia bacterium]|jgi:hypothetical protein|nr:hypothetical protein [Clostridia bacterium]
MKKKFLTIFLISIFICLTITLVACNGFGNSPSGDDDNNNNQTQINEESVLNGLPTNLKLNYTVRQGSNEQEVIFYKIGKHILIKTFDENIRTFRYRFFGYLQYANSWRFFTYTEGDSYWEEQHDYHNLSAKELLQEDLLYNLFYAFLDPAHNYLEKSQSLGAENLMIDNISFACEHYQYHDPDQGVLFFGISKINGFKICLQYESSAFKGQVTAYKSGRFDIPTFAAELPLEAPEEIYGETGGERTKPPVIKLLPLNLKISYTTTYNSKVEGETRTTTEKTTVYKVGFDILTVTDRGDLGKTYFYCEYNPKSDRWKGYKRYPSPNAWQEGNPAIEDKDLFNLDNLPYARELFSLFRPPEGGDRNTSSRGYSPMIISHVHYSPHKYERTVPETSETILFWILDVNKTPICLKYTVSDNQFFETKSMEVTDYIVERIEFPTGVRPSEFIGGDPGGGTGEDPGGGTGEDPGGGTGEDPGGGTGGEQEIPRTAAEILTSLGNNLKITFEKHYNDMGLPWTVSYNVYKFDNNFLFEEYENRFEDYSYIYYKYNDVDKNWDEYLIVPGDEAWTSARVDLDALTAMSEISRGDLKIMLWDFIDPIYGYEEETTLIGTESLTISGNVYTCSKYSYINTQQDIDYTFWVTNIDGVHHCLKKTDNSGYLTFEVSTYLTGGVETPNTCGVPLP